MQIIPVIDLLNRVVVRGVAGQRDEYRPLVSQLTGSHQPKEVVQALVEEFQPPQVYVADLDAILKGKPNQRIYGQINKLGVRLLLDAGIRDLNSAEILAEKCADLSPDFVLGLESLAAPRNVVEIVRALGRPACVFSLDLKQGRPLTNILAWQSLPPLEIARQVIDAGVGRLIVLDLADVGVGAGTSTLDLLRQIGDLFPKVELIGGGGVRTFSDLELLHQAGASAALVASALHDGRIALDDWNRAARLDAR